MADEPVQIPLEQTTLGLTGFSIVQDDMQLTFILIAGNIARSYLVSPIHAKRILMLLQKSMSDYENKFGEIQTSLPAAKEQTTNRKVGFQVDEADQKK